jgi:hypothetical protein
MSISRRKFFTGLCGSLGAVGVVNILLSRQGWLKFWEPAKAQAGVMKARVRQPQLTYTLRSRFQFFEGKPEGGFPADLPLPPSDELGDPIPPGRVNRIRNDRMMMVRMGPNIIEFDSDLPSRRIRRVIRLSPSAAFITRLLLMGTDTGTLSEMYVSRGWAADAGAAYRAIDSFIKGYNFFQPKTDFPKQDLNFGADSVSPTPSKIWANFSMGSAYAVSALKIP